MKRNRFMSFLLHVSSRSLLDVLTDSGKVILVAVSVCLFAFWGYPFVSLFCGLTTLLSVALCIAFLFTPRLQVSMVGDPVCYADETATLHVVLENRSRFAARDLSLTTFGSDRTWRCLDEVMFLGTIAPGESISLTLQFVPQKRGVFDWPWVRIESTFPFGLCSRKQDAKCEAELGVAPRRIHESDRFSTNQLNSLLGAVESLKYASGTDYLGSREYIPGTPPGRWDFASWGRVGKPIVRETSLENQFSVMILVDLFHAASELRNKRSLKRFEVLLEAAVSLGDILVRRQFCVSFLLPDASEPSRMVELEGKVAMAAFARCTPIALPSSMPFVSLHDSHSCGGTKPIIAVIRDEVFETRSFVKDLFPSRRVEFLALNTIESAEITPPLVLR